MSALGPGCSKRWRLKRLGCLFFGSKRKGCFHNPQTIRNEGKALVGYVQDIPFKNEFFQTVVVSEVLEHLGDEELHRALAEIHRVLATGGRIIGTVPARENLRDQLVVCPKCGERFHRWGHAQTFDSVSIKALLSRHFDVEQAFECLFVDWTEVDWKGKIRGLVKKILFRMSLYGRYENIVFSGRKCD
jgi:SAM-dependent methyltransferase